MQKFRVKQAVLLVLSRCEDYITDLYVVFSNYWSSEWKVACDTIELSPQQRPDQYLAKSLQSSSRHFIFLLYFSQIFLFCLGKYPKQKKAYKMHIQTLEPNSVTSKNSC